MRQIDRLETILKAAVLGGLGLMFYAKLSDGTLSFYINQRFMWLSFVAVLLLAVLALTLVYRLIERRASAEELHDHDESHAQAGHEHGHKLTWSGVAFLALPMLLGLLVPARPLGASAIANRGIGLTAPDRPGSATVAQRAVTGPRNVLDWLREFAGNADPVAFKGQAVDVVGFVYRDPRNSNEQFWVSRFTISCCVADASAIGLLVQTAQAADLKNDGWVQVTGKLDVGEFAGEKLAVIVPDKIVPVDQPQNPYLYP